MDEAAYTPSVDEQEIERHAIATGAEIARQLSALLHDRETVALHVAGKVYPAQVVDLDSSRGTMDLEPAASGAGWATLRGPDPIVAVALPQGVKLQFELRDRVVVDDGSRARLRAMVPVRLARLQRRTAFRVEPPPQALPRLSLSLGTRETVVPVLDLSATGIAFAWPDRAGTAPAIGAVLPDCRLQLPANPPIRCSLQVRVARDRDDGSTRLGCRFDALDSGSERALQVYVNHAQTLVRRLRPRIE